jgi:membrane-associated phospholipid phosphatase
MDAMPTKANESLMKTPNLRLVVPTPEVLDVPQPKALTRQFAIGIAILALVPLAIGLDRAVAVWISNDPFPGDFSKAVNLAEAFAHGVGVFLILLGIGTMSPQCRWYLPRLGALAYGSGGLTTLVKMFVIRERPHFLLHHTQAEAIAWNWRFDWSLSLLTTVDESLRSFPSGHTATAVALAIGLGSLFPRGRYLFWSLAIMATLQRLQAEAHFFSDVLAGWGVGMVWSALLLHPRWLGGIFSRFEPSQDVWSKGVTIEEPQARAA